MSLVAGGKPPRQVVKTESVSGLLLLVVESTPPIIS